MDITSETPTQEILNNTTENRNGLMCALAGRVFQKSDGRMLKAYTNFGFKKLALVIDAKRMGIFDFGVTIRQTDTGGYVFPMDTDAVLSAIKLAEDERYDEVDLKALNLLDEQGSPIVPLKSIFPQYVEEAPPANLQEPLPSSASDNDVATQQIATAVDENKTLSFREVDAIIKESLGLKRVHTKRRNAILAAGQSQGLFKVEEDRTVVSYIDLYVSDEPAEEEVESSPNLIVLETEDSVEISDPLPAEETHRSSKEDPSLKLLVALTGYQGRFENQLNQLAEEVKSENDISAERQDYLLAYLQTIDKNMRAILTYFVDPHFDFVEPPPSGLFAPKEASSRSIEPLPKLVTLPPHTVHDGTGEECDDCTSIRESQAETSTPPEVVSQEASADNGQQEGFTYKTPDELESMDLAKLRAFGEKLGVPPARYDWVMRKRILAKYKELGKVF